MYKFMGDMMSKPIGITSSNTNHVVKNLQISPPTNRIEDTSSPLYPFAQSSDLLKILSICQKQQTPSPKQIQDRVTKK